MYRVHTLPANFEKNKVEKDTEEKPLQSIEDSLVLLQALRQSRQTWLTSAFTKFSTRSRGGKSTEIWQPPHTLRFRGKCDIEIGPHVFYATSVYEVIYHSYSVPATPQSATSSSKLDGTRSLTVSSDNNHLPITNELISQVNIAAQTNPTLANLITVAASGSATAEQLQSLGVTLQSLAESKKTIDGASAPSDAPITVIPSNSVTPSRKSTADKSTPTSNASVLSLRPPQVSKLSNESTPYQNSPAVHIPAKESDVLIEFYENSSDRWILPKQLVVYEKLTRWDGVNSFADIIFSTILPFQYSTSQHTSSATLGTESPQDGEGVCHPITLRFFNVPISIWNLFAPAAADGERTKRVRMAIEAKLAKAATRMYLQHQISDGPLFSQLLASASDRYPMKGIKTNGLVSGAGQAKRRISAVAGSAPKKKKPALPRKVESRTGTCTICKRASIVLAPGSTWCPPCRKKLLAGEVIPPASDSVLPLSTSDKTQIHDAKPSGIIPIDFSVKQTNSLAFSSSSTPNESQLQNYYVYHSPYAQYQTSAAMEQVAQANTTAPP